MKTEMIKPVIMRVDGHHEVPGATERASAPNNAYSRPRQQGHDSQGRSIS
jgi:hypothetical protein